MDVIQVTELNPTASFATQIIRGNAEPFVNRIDVNGVAGRIKFTNTVWELFTVLVPGANEFVLEPYDISGQKLASVTVVIDFPDINSEIINVLNTFDDWGSHLNLTRRKGEKNQSYKERLLQHAKSRFGTSTRAATKAISVDLSLRTVIDRFGVYLKINPSSGTPYLNNATIAVLDSAIEIGAEQFVISGELNVVDPITLSVVLTEKIRVGSPTKINVVTSFKVPISPDRYDVDLKTNSIIFRDRQYARSDVLITYPYSERIPYIGKELGFVRSALNAVTHQGNFVIGAEDITVLPEFDDSALADDLIQQYNPVRLFPKDGMPVDVSPLESMHILSVSSVRVRTLSLTKGLYLNERGGIYDAKMEAWRSPLIKNSGTIWNRVVFGRDRWQEEDVLPHMNFFPHLTDPLRGFFTRKGTKEEITLTQLRELGLVGDTTIEYDGVPEKDWHSGVGTQGDLWVEVVEVVRKTMEDFFLEEDAKDAVGIFKP